MAAAKSRTTAAQAAAMGMVGPAAGMKLLEKLLAARIAGVSGGASAVYWRLLLRSVKQPPAIFAAVLADVPAAEQVGQLSFDVISQISRWSAVARLCCTHACSQSCEAL